eukprot:352193_1
MEKLITFRQMCERLSINEYQQFVDTTFGQDKHNQHMLSQILFHYFYQKLIHPYNAPNQPEQITIDTINETLLTIIENRPENCNSDDNYPEISDYEPDINALELVDIPHQTIQKIASYLPVKSYVSFERCNRFIFTTLRTPSMLLCLGGSMAAINISQTSLLVQSLRVHSRINELIVSPRNTNAIKHIERYKLNKLIIHSTLSSADFDYFLNNNTFNWNNIKYLYLYGYTRSWTESLVCSILNKCTTLSFLDFRQEEDDEDQFPHIPPFNKLRSIIHLTKLKGLSIDSYNECMDPLVALISDSIESLHLCFSFEMVFWNDDSIEFHHLKELHLTDPFPGRLNRFLNTAQKLERVSLVDELEQMYVEDDYMSIAESFRRLFQLQSLKYFHFECESLQIVKDIVDIFRISLIDLKKTTLKIHLVFGKAVIHTTDVISNLVAILDECCDDFMLIYQYQMQLRKLNQNCDTVK